MNSSRNWAMSGRSSVNFCRLNSYVLNASTASFSTLAARFSLSANALSNRTSLAPEIISGCLLWIFDVTFMPPSP